MKVSKNFSKGKPIKDLREIKRLALERKSVVFYVGGGWHLRPAAFILGWPLNMVINSNPHYSIKIK